MIYPATLRAALLASPLAIREDDLFVFVTGGTVKQGGKSRSPAKGARAFTAEYKLCLIVTDFAKSEDALLLFVNDWLDGIVAQGADVWTARGEGYEFESDIVDNAHVDITLMITMREQVTVAQDNTGITLSNT